MKQSLNKRGLKEKKNQHLALIHAHFYRLRPTNSIFVRSVTHDGKCTSYALTSDFLSDFSVATLLYEETPEREDRGWEEDVTLVH